MSLPKMVRVKQLFPRAFFDDVREAVQSELVSIGVESIIKTKSHIENNSIAISQGPVTFGRDGHVSVFIRDPDRNTLELRGRVEDEDTIPGLEFYDPKA